jgi:dihydroorotase (multifunctional complex type)
LTVDLLLTDAKAYTKGKLRDCSIAINEGKIFKIGKQTNMPKAESTIGLKSLLVLPGIIDAHVHLRDEGKAYKEDFYSGTAAAAAGGITTVLDMPNNAPVTMSAVTLRNRMEIAKKKVLVNVAFYSEFPKKKDEIGNIVKEGALGFKLFMVEQVGGLDIGDDNALFEAFKIVESLQVPVAVHAEDEATIEATRTALERTNGNDVEAFLKAHSVRAEEIAIKRLLNIAEKTGVRTHFCHVSTRNGLKAIVDGKKLGLPVTCEVTPHHLLLSVEDLRQIGSTAIMLPPLREEEHIIALWNGIKNEQVDTIGSDHAPHTLEEKINDVVWNVKVGIPGLETLLPLLLTEVNRGRLTIAELVRLTAEEPAAIFNLKNRGKIAEGNHADLTVVDLKRKYAIDASMFQSKAKYSPFNQWNARGRAVKTFVNGQAVMDEDEIIGEAVCGDIVQRG